MKKIILIAIMFLTAISGYAQICEVKMINQYRETVSVFRSYEGCKESMKQCRLEIRRRLQSGQNSSYDCLISSNDDDQNPTPERDRGTSRGSDYLRPLKTGETVIYNNNYVIVLGVSYGELYSVRSTDGFNRITSEIRRSLLSTTNGCSSDICIDDTIIEVNRGRYFKVIGLGFYGDYVIRSTDGFYTISSQIHRNDMALTSGCIGSHYEALCVGNNVLNSTNNRYFNIVGIQTNGKVVLRSTDGFNNISSNIDPRLLIKI